MTTPRYEFTATLLPTGKVLIAGGHAPTSPSFLASAELYDPSTGVFTTTGDMTTARYGHSATLLPDGKVLIAGGYTTPNPPFRVSLASAELYDPSTGTFTVTANMVTAGRATAVLLADGKVLLAHDADVLSSSPAAAELYDPVSGTFSATADQLRGSFDHQQAALLPDGRVLLLFSGEIYDPASRAFSLTGAMTGVYGYPFALAPLANGKVLHTGGYNEGVNVFSAGAELYDPSTGTFAATGNMTIGRSGHTATLLPDGTVLIAGGGVGSSSTVSAELYDPAAGTFSRTGDMTRGRSNHTAILLLNGTVLIAGAFPDPGTDPGISGTAELYTPARLAPPAALLSLSGDGKGQGAILHAGTPQVVSADNRAVAREALEVYCTGLADGSVIPPQVSIGGLAAEVLFFGKAPGFAGLNQVNVRVPGGVAPGDSVPVRLTYLGRPSNTVTIGVR
jgi:hypothetical protein